MQNQSKREKLKELRIKRKNESDQTKKNELLKQIVDLEDSIRKDEFDGDDNIKRFNTVNPLIFLIILLKC